MKQNRPDPHKYERVSSEIKRIITEVVSYEIENPLVLGNCEVTDVITTHDFSYSKVFISINEDKLDKKKEILDALKGAAGFVKHIVKDTLDIRKVPDIGFIYDDTKEKKDRIEKILEEIKK